MRRGAAPVDQGWFDPKSAKALNELRRVETVVCERKGIVDDVVQHDAAVAWIRSLRSGARPTR
jgi:hypothetical protein